MGQTRDFFPPSGLKGGFFEMVIFAPWGIRISRYYKEGLPDQRSHSTAPYSFEK